MDSIIIHYSEIAIKGGNRAFFEKILNNNIRNALGSNISRLYKVHGRIIGDLK